MWPHVFRCVNNCFLWVIYVGQQFCSIFPLYEVLYLSFDAQLYLVISLLCACSSSISTYKAQCTHKTTTINWWMSIKPWNSLITPGINCNELAGDLPKASWSYNVPLKIFKTPTFSLFTQCQSVTTATLAGLPIDRSDHATCDWIRFNTIQCNLMQLSTDITLVSAITAKAYSHMPDVFENLIVLIERFMKTTTTWSISELDICRQDANSFTFTDISQLTFQCALL